MSKSKVVSSKQLLLGWTDNASAESEQASSLSVGRHRLLGQYAAIPFVLRMQGVCAELQLDVLPQELISKVAACARLFGGTVVATADELSFMPIKELPRRIESIWPDRLPTMDAIQSADAIELRLNQPTDHNQVVALSSLEFQWPIDVPTLEILNKKTELLRTLSQASLPVGISIPIVEPADQSPSIAWVRDMCIDFIVLRSPQASLSVNHRALSYFEFDPEAAVGRFRSKLESTNPTKVLIGIDYPWRDGYQAARVHRAGADFVFVDSYLLRQAPMGKELSHAFDDWSRLGIGTARGSADALVDRTALLKRLIHTWDINQSMQMFVEEFRSMVEYFQ